MFQTLGLKLVNKWLCFYNIKEDDVEGEEDPRNLNIQESEG